MIIGYARVSTHDQNLDSQLDALQKADCEQIFQEKITGKSKDRPELISCLKALRKGDVLVVWKLDRLEHSLIRERTIAGLDAARARGRKGGRKPSMSEKDIKKAQAMLRDPQITKTEVAKHFGVSRVTLNSSLNKS